MNRAPSAVNTVVLSTASSFIAETQRPSTAGSHGSSVPSLAASSFKPNPVTVGNTSNNHFSPGMSNNSPSSTNMDNTPSQASLAARRLVSSAQPLIVPGLSVASNIVQSTTSTSASNVIVFQRGKYTRKFPSSFSTHFSNYSFTNPV